MLKTFKLQTESMCEVRCFEENNCVSYNLGSWDEDGAYRCELSYSDHDTHPEALVRQNGVTYKPTEVSNLQGILENSPTKIRALIG